MAQNESGINKDLQKMSTNASVESAYQDMDLWLANLAKQENATLVSMEAIRTAQERVTNKLLEQKIKAIKESAKSEQEAATEIAKLKENHYKEELKIASKMEENIYKYGSTKVKARIAEQRKLTAKEYSEKLKQEMELLAVTKMNGKARNSQMKKLREKQREADQEVVKNARLQAKLTKATAVYNSDQLKERNKLVSQAHAEEAEAHRTAISNMDEQIAKLKEKEEEAKKNAPDGDTTAGSTFREEIEELESAKKEEKKSAKKDDQQRFADELGGNALEGLTNAVEQGFSKMADALAKGVDEAIDTVGQYKSFIDARLQTSFDAGSPYDDVAKTLKRALAVSPYVKQADVLKKLNDAVDKGIAYNVEQRAFLATISDKIVSTFDAFDSNLMRIIRLQQADTTQARMGMEAQLLQFFNSTFSDNSYLVDGYDAVSQALLDANAQMSREMSVAFEYNVQKWLGSLASLGFGTDTITKIATGIGYLGTGNVQALTGDTELMNLMAMSASRAGYSISDLLVQGIDDSSVNDLLKSMVEYLAEIADSNNAVVKAAYGDVFSFSQSDLRAVSNLIDGDIANIYGNKIDYNRAVSHLTQQLNAIPNRLSMTEMINNAFDNFLYTSGESIASDFITAITWKTLTVIEQATGGIEIPFVNVWGFGLDLNMSLESLLKTGIFGLSALGNIGSIISSMGSNGGLDLSIWNAYETTQRGGAFNPTVGGVQKTFSGSKNVVSSSSSSDSKKSAISSTSEDQEEAKKSSKESMKDEITLETLYKEIFEKKTPVYVTDVPILTPVNSIATAVASVNDNIQSIAKKIDNEGSSIKVNVTNFDVLTKALAPKDKIGINAVDDDAAIAIANKVVNTLTNNGEFSAMMNVVRTLKDGTLSVNDSDANNKLYTISQQLTML